MMRDLAVAVAVFLCEKGLSSVHGTNHGMPEEFHMYKSLVLVGLLAPKSLSIN